MPGCPYDHVAIDNFFGTLKSKRGCLTNEVTFFCVEKTLGLYQSE